jgi:hypothetical protein
MGTQGWLRVSAVLGRRGDVVVLPRLALVASSLAILAVVGGCSSSPPWSSSNAPPNGGQAAVPPPGQQAYTPPPGQPGYAPPPGQQAYAPPPQAPQQEAGTVGSMRQSYAGFLSMFRDSPDQDPNAQPGYDARASVRSPPPPATSAAPTQSAYVPRPPNTYTPSQQPYVPPQGQGAYSPPPQQNYAAPPAQQNYAPQSQSGYPPRSAQQSYAPPPPAYSATAAAAPAAQRDYSDSLPYPKQSLVDAFRDSADPQNQTVPHPPSSYTPSGQPYSPQGQQANGARPPGAPAVAAAPPPPPDPTDSLPYPKQTLFGN